MSKYALDWKGKCDNFKARVLANNDLVDDLIERGLNIDEARKEIRNVGAIACAAK